MTKPKNHNKEWTPAEAAKLKELANGNTPTCVMGIKLQRTLAAVQNRGSQENVSSKPTNQLPYNRIKKK